MKKNAIEKVSSTFFWGFAGVATIGGLVAVTPVAVTGLAGMAFTQGVFWANHLMTSDTPAEKQKTEQ